MTTKFENIRNEIEDEIETFRTWKNNLSEGETVAKIAEYLDEEYPDNIDENGEIAVEIYNTI